MIRLETIQTPNKPKLLAVEWWQKLFDQIKTTPFQIIWFYGLIILNIHHQDPGVFIPTIKVELQFPPGPQARLAISRDHWAKKPPYILKWPWCIQLLIEDAIHRGHFSTNSLKMAPGTEFLISRPAHRAIWYWCHPFHEYTLTWLHRVRYTGYK